MSHPATVLRRTVILCALVGSFGSEAAGDPIRFTSARLVEGQAAAEVVGQGDFETRSFENRSLPGLFDVALADAAPRAEFGDAVAGYAISQHTNVSATRWSGTGAVETSAIPWAGGLSSTGAAFAESIMTIEFTLAAATPYRFTGTLSGDGYSAATLDGPAGFGWAFFGTGDAVPLVALKQGLLAPGDYVFDARVTASADSIQATRNASAFDVQFTLDPVPEPATLLLVGSGTAFLAGRRWRRRGNARRIDEID